MNSINVFLFWPEPVVTSCLKHNISCSKPISIFTGSQVMCLRPIRKEFSMKSNNIHLLVFEKLVFENPNLKNDRFVKDDFD